MSADRDARLRSFDEAPDQYAAWRPGYPSQAFDEIARMVAPPARVLEIGPGPGVATLPLAQRGYAITGVEIGSSLADVARARLAGFPDVRIVTGDFHRFEPEAGAFDLVLAASSFHWLDQQAGYRKAWTALREEGWLALLWNASVRGRGPAARFWDATDEVYRQHAAFLAVPPEARVRGRARRELDRRREIRASGLFRPVLRRSWRWARSFDAQGYLALLDTYSDHRVLPAEERRTLYGALRQLIEARFGGTARREYLTILYLAQRAAPAIAWGPARRRRGDQAPGG